MAEVRPLDASAFDDVYEELLHDLNPRLARAAWHRLFDPPWSVPDPTVGYGLYDPRQGLVGFLGTVRSELRHQGRTSELCNLTSWTVKPAFRSESLALLAPVLARQEATLTNLTPIREVHQVVSKLGFRTLETHRTTIWLGLRGVGRGEVVTDEERMPSLLPVEDRRILEDHGDAARHLVVVDPDLGPVYLLYRLVRRMHIAGARLYHIGNRGAFPGVVHTALRHLFLRHGAVRMDYDARLTSEAVPGARTRALEVPRMYRSREVGPSALSNAYSELVLLGL